MNMEEMITHKLTRAEFVKFIMDSTQNIKLSSYSCDDFSVTPEMPGVNITTCMVLPFVIYVSIRYFILTIDNLHLVPHLTVLYIYNYFRSDGKGAFKSLDRAVKHTAVGDVRGIFIALVSEDFIRNFVHTHTHTYKV